MFGAGKVVGPNHADPPRHQLLSRRSARKDKPLCRGFGATFFLPHSRSYAPPPSLRSKACYDFLQAAEKNWAKGRDEMLSDSSGQKMLNILRQENKFCENAGPGVGGGREGGGGRDEREGMGRGRREEVASGEGEGKEGDGGGKRRREQGEREDTKSDILIPMTTVCARAGVSAR